MVEIIRLGDARNRRLVEMGFRSWRRRFKTEFGMETRLMDIGHGVLLQLAQPGEESCDLLNDLIIGFMGHPADTGFGSLEMWIQAKIVDMHLFLADQLRFEMMARLGWLTRFIAGRFPLFQIVRDYEQVKTACQQQPPLLSEDHRDYENYRNLFERDKQVFIRRMLPSALEAFGKAFCGP